MIRITAATTIKDRDLNSVTTVERVLNGHAAAFSVLAAAPIESKAKITEQHKHNTINVTDNISLFN